MSRHRLVRAGLTASLLVLMTGCATVIPADDPTQKPVDAWRGRLAVKVEEGAPAAAARAFSADFDLQGAPQAGELSLYTPLGTTAAQVHWQSGQAWLQTPAQTQHFPDLETLLQTLLGTEVPVRALFAWLHGQAADADGWEVDLRAHDQGRIVAMRWKPPQARLLIQLHP